MGNIPTRSEVIQKARNLANGEVDPVEIAKWAQGFYYPENQELLDKLINDDPALEDLLGDLTLADAINEKGELLYTRADFKDWLNEFLQGTLEGHAKSTS